MVYGLAALFVRACLGMNVIGLFPMLGPTTTSQEATASTVPDAAQTEPETALADLIGEFSFEEGCRPDLRISTRGAEYFVGDTRARPLAEDDRSGFSIPEVLAALVMDNGAIVKVPIGSTIQGGESTTGYLLLTVMGPLELHKVASNPATSGVDPPAAQSWIRIINISPDPASILTVGATVRIEVEVEYNIFASHADVGLVVGASDGSGQVMKLDRVPRGEGRGAFGVEFVVPETDAVHAWAPLLLDPSCDSR